MADFGIEIKGDPTGISALTFKATVNDAINLLHEYDTAISGVSQGSLSWYLAQLSLTPNVQVAFRSRLRPRRRGPVVVDNSDTITHSLLSGLDSLEHKAVTPPYISVGGIERVQHMVSLIGKNGATGFRVRADNNAVDLTPATIDNIEKILPVRRTSIGSVEGKLEGINLHRKLRVIVYHAITNKAVTCDIREEFLDKVKECLGKRVVVFGILHKNINGDTLRVTMQRLVLAEELLETSTRARIMDDPVFTSAATTADYIRRIRGG